MSASVYRTVLVCRCMPYSAVSAGMYHTSRLSVGVYHIVQSYVCRCIPYRACLQVYAIQRYVCGHVPYIVLVCRRIPYPTELCLQAYTLSYRAMSASVYRTVLVCRCMPYSVMSAGMYHTSRLSVGVYHIIQSYVCRRIPCSACLSAGVCHTVLCTIHRACLLVYIISYRAMSASLYRTVLVCRCMPYSALSAGMYHTSRLSVGVYHIIQSYVCRSIPCSACLSAGVCHTVLCLRACTIHRACL
jgi:hypothetical protein